MKRILLVGGGTGGHIMPLIAVADEMGKMSGKMIRADYLGPRSRFFGDFEARGVRPHAIVGSKLRRYFSPANLFFPLLFLIGFCQALVKLYFIMPDVIFSKGGPSALAVVCAARFYFIPVIVHESDTIPGLTNRISGRFAKKIIVAFPSAALYFKKSKTVLLGNPVGPGLLDGVPEQPAAKAILGLDPKRPAVFIIGGSQGAQRINQFVLENLPAFLEKFQILHQTGAANLREADAMSRSSLDGVPEGKRGGYKLFGFMDIDEMRNAYAAADLVVSRAGANSIAEIATFGRPAIIVPIPEAVAGEHQIVNAEEYAKTGAASVFTEANLTPHAFLAEAERILDSEDVRQKMSVAARSFAKPNAAADIAKEILTV